MPNRLSEAILNEIMTRDGKLATQPKSKQLNAILTNIDDLPFLAIESDGSPFPQLINAKLETFCLRAKRLHHQMRQVKNPNQAILYGKKENPIDRDGYASPTTDDSYS